ncbi:hypothetical protein [Streptomyces sp. NBC_01618]|uniref:hypothetical protein n=1 Tax=Streptomyces sp. NBC_01618 TaxID=2975900 RepID=UPI003870DA5C
MPGPSDDGGFEEVEESFDNRSTRACTCVVNSAIWISSWSIRSSFAASRLRAAANSPRTAANSAKRSFTDQSGCPTRTP